MLDIVITGRHDNHGGPEFFERLRAAAEHNHRVLHACGVDHTFTLVEWNPVDGRRLLTDLVRERLPWWHECLVIDPEWHRRLSTNPRLQFMEFFAKNAAIRRSRADAVLTTNTDVFFSTELARALASQPLDDRVVYRAVRVDVDRQAPWRTGGEAVLADPAWRLRVNDLQPPEYANSAGDFLLLTRRAWQALGGFNERVRFAKIHKDGQFCINACLEGYAFAVLGPVYHIDHDGSYANAGAMRGSADAPYGPEWNYRTRYRNPAAWGLSAAVDESAGGVVYVHHPATHGPLLSVIVPQRDVTAPCVLTATHGDHEELRISADGDLARGVNAALAQARGRFLVVTADPALESFGGPLALLQTLRTTAAGLVVPAGGCRQHPVLGPVPDPGTPYVMRRDLVDGLIEWDEAAPDPALEFWLRAVERTAVAESGPSTVRSPRLPFRIDAGMQVRALTRRGAPVTASLLERAICERLAVGCELRDLIRQWIESTAPDAQASYAIVGPDWATPLLLDALAATGRTLAGVFTAVPDEAGTTRWGERFRPLAEVLCTGATCVLTGADTRVKDRLAALGFTGRVHVISQADDVETTAPNAELDGLRRAQARDLTHGTITAIRARLPLLTLLEGERGWAHRYDAAHACERAGRGATALEMFREVMADCTTDQSLSMRAAFHTARLLAARGAFHQAAPLLKKILKHNPAHKAARQLLDECELDIPSLSR